MNIEFSYKKMMIKGVKFFVIFLVPVLVDKFIVSYPQIAQLTISGMLVMGVNYLKVKCGINL